MITKENPAWHELKGAILGGVSIGLAPDGTQRVALLVRWSTFTDDKVEQTLCLKPSEDYGVDTNFVLKSEENLVNLLGGEILQAEEDASESSDDWGQHSTKQVFTLLVKKHKMEYEFKLMSFSSSNGYYDENVQLFLL